MLSFEELMIAADAAEKYPKGVDDESWGYGPLKGLLINDLIRKLRYRKNRAYG